MDIRGARGVSSLASIHDNLNYAPDSRRMVDRLDSRSTKDARTSKRETVKIRASKSSAARVRPSGGRIDDCLREINFADARDNSPAPMNSRQARKANHAARKSPTFGEVAR